MPQRQAPLRRLGPASTHAPCGRTPAASRAGWNPT